LLHKFHALQYPQQHVGGMDIGRAVGLPWEGWVDSPGRDMLDPELPIALKIVEIRDNFIPVARWSNGHGDMGLSRPDRLRAFLDTSVADEEKRLWTDDSGEVVPVSRLLPDDKVVEAMFRAWGDGRHQARCAALSAYIGQWLLAH